MGGIGSGRTGWLISRSDCVVLDYDKLAKLGLFDREKGAGELCWNSLLPGAPSLVSDYEVFKISPHHVQMALRYVRRIKGESRTVVEVIQVLGKPEADGIRWSFVCPLQSREGECGRKVPQLYLPPGCSVFGCASCYGLARPRRGRPLQIEDCQKITFRLVEELFRAQRSAGIPERFRMTRAELEEARRKLNIAKEKPPDSGMTPSGQPLP